MTFATVTTSLPNDVAIHSFVAHHLQLGAKELFLFVDDPDANLTTLCNNPDGKVKLFYCTDHYWRTYHGIAKPEDHRRRQVLNANLALALSTADFIAHIDIDEFILSHRPIQEVLASLPFQCNGLRLLPAEAIYSEVPRTYGQAFSNLFKRRLNDDKSGNRILSELHGSEASLLEKGLQGHNVGKVIVRKRDTLKLNLHFASHHNKKLSYAFSDSVELLHFVFQGPADWLDKYARRLASSRYAFEKPTRQKQWRSVVEAASRGVDELWSLYTNLNIYDADRIRSLERHGLLVRHELDLPAKAQAILGYSKSFYNKPLPEFDALASSRALSDIWNKLEKQMNAAQEQQVKRQPQEPSSRQLLMDKLSIAPFEMKLKKAKVYLEFGSGGSTLRACELAVPEIHTVETSKDFIDEIVKNCKSIDYNGKLHTHFVDIGPTKAWGYPVSSDSSIRWSNYCIAPWKALKALGSSPDLILVDGRFRVAAFLYSLTMARKGTTIFVDDYKNRSHYHVVEDIIQPIRFHGRMAEFRKKQNPCVMKTIELLSAAIIDPR
jgi:hypothetical protein